MRTTQMIDAELRVLSGYRAACTQTGQPVRTTTEVDRLLDERAALTATDTSYPEAGRHVSVPRI